MIETISKDTLDEFRNITSYDVEKFIDDFLSFLDNDYNFIVNFYTGTTSIHPTESINRLNDLFDQSIRIEDVVILNSNSLQQYKFWALTEQIDDIRHQLETTKNFSKWSRSSVTGSGYKSDLRSDYMLKQGQGLEDIERDVLRSNDPDQWVDTALQNAITEEDYELDGGELLKVVFKNNASISLEGVIDHIDDPKKTYGLDVDANIDIINSDIKVLGYKETLFQSMDILSSLFQGDDPAFIERGLKLKGIIGGNIAAISYPAIFRDLAGNFATDDCFKAISVTDVSREQDAVSISYQVQTKVGDLLNNSVQL